MRCVRDLWKPIAAEIAMSAICMLFWVAAASAQAWWDSVEDGKPELTHGFLPLPSIATSLPYNGDPGGYPSGLASAASSTA